ncbi:MAG: hypothetical protein RR622_07900 [Hydrogenoanaerobacterium sp.]
MEDLQVYFVPEDQAVVDCCSSIKAKCAEILSVSLEVEPVPFNKGFFAVDITFFFRVKLNAFAAPCSSPTSVEGLAFFTKKVILYGSEGNVRVFCSDNPSCGRTSSMPTACVSVVDPIILAARVGCCRKPCHDNCCDTCCDCCDPCHCNDHCSDGCGCNIEIPEEICREFNGEFSHCKPERCVYVTIGLFTIVQLERDVQMLIPAYDFCIPNKECLAGNNTTTDDPCEVFKAIKFPITDFFPPHEQECGCKG